MKIAEAAPEKKLKLVARGCDLKGLGSDEEVSATDVDSLLLGLLVRDWLRVQKMDAADALGRQVAGLDKTPGLERPTPMLDELVLPPQ